MSYMPGLHMDCDFTSAAGHRCLRAVTNAPRVVIPGTADSHGLPVRIMTTSHACDIHQRSFDLHAYLSGRTKARIERQCREVRGPDFRPDFDAAYVEAVLVTTPEYRQFLNYIGETLYVPAA